MKIESDKVEVNKSCEEVFNFLSDFRNFEKLLPEDKISDWKATEDTCGFTIKGMAEIGMKIENKVPNSQINIKSHGENPFDFTLNAFMEETEPGKCKGFMIFDADVNPFMKMMVQKPLTNFFNMLTHKLKEV